MSETTTTNTLEIGETYRGHCIKWIPQGHYGFLRVEGVARDIFTHGRNVLNAGSLERGDDVRFEIALDRQGRLHAIDCEVLS